DCVSLLTSCGAVRKVANLQCNTDPRDGRLPSANDLIFDGEPEVGGLAPGEQERFAEISRRWIESGPAPQPTGPRVVYGYGLVPVQEPSRPGQVRAAIRAFASDRGLLLGTTFVDQAQGDAATGRPGLAALLGVLR